MINMSSYWFLICCCLIHTHAHACVCACVLMQAGSQELLNMTFYFLPICWKQRQCILFKSQTFLPELQGAISFHVVYQYAGCENKLLFYASFALSAYFKRSLQSIRTLQCCSAYHIKSSITSHSQICHVLYSV